jgi:hypothetical protein
VSICPKLHAYYTPCVMKVMSRYYFSIRFHSVTRLMRSRTQNSKCLCLFRMYYPRYTIYARLPAPSEHSPTSLLQVIPTPIYRIPYKAIPHDLVNISEVEVKYFRQTNPKASLTASGNILSLGDDLVNSSTGTTTEGTTSNESTDGAVT